MAARKDLFTVALPAPRPNRRRWCCSVPAWRVWPAQRVVVAKPRRKRERLSRTLPDGSLVHGCWEVGQLSRGASKALRLFVLTSGLVLGKEGKQMNGSFLIWQLAYCKNKSRKHTSWSPPQITTRAQTIRTLPPASY